MKVYQVISSFHPRIGGAERATGTLSRGLIQRECRVEVLTTWYPGLKRFEVIDGVPVRRLGFGGPGKLASLSFGLHTFLWVLRHGRSTPLIHTQNISTPLLVGMLLKLFTPKRWVVTIHGSHRIPDKRRTFLGPLRLKMMRCLADHFVAISERNRQLMLEEGVLPEQISSIPHAIDVGFFRPPSPEERRTSRARYGYAPDDVVVLFLGRLISLKRVDLLIRAVADLEPGERVKCVIVGDGPEGQDLKALVKELALDGQVRFVGLVANVRDFYWSSDVFVLPSRSEGLPVALLESMACGAAVLVSKCAGNLEVVKDGVNGLTCNVDDTVDLAQQLQRLANDANLRRMLREKARQTILEKCSMQAVADAHLRVYTELLAQTLQ